MALTTFQRRTVYYKYRRLCQSLRDVVSKDQPSKRGGRGTLYTLTAQAVLPRLVPSDVV